MVSHCHGGQVVLAFPVLQHWVERQKSLICSDMRIWRLFTRDEALSMQNAVIWVLDGEGVQISSVRTSGRARSR